MGAAVSESKAKRQSPPVQDRRALAEQYVPYVRHIAGKIKRSLAREIEYDDLVEYGMIGLMEAADRFDSAQGANFMTFAYYRIRGAIYDGLRTMGWMSRSAYAKARFEERANNYLSQAAQQHQAADGEAGAAVNEGPLEHAVHHLTAAVQGLAAVYITSLDAAENMELPDDSEPLAEEKLGLEQSRARVRRTLKKLSEQERQLLEMYYYKDMTLEQIGAQLKLSKSWTSRLHGRVIDKMHRLLEQPEVHSPPP